MVLLNAIIVLFFISGLNVSYLICGNVTTKNTSVVPDEELVSVTTTGGEIVGKRVKVTVSNVNINNNLYVTRFYGIQYAEPPIGNLRFKAPVKASAWVGKRNALNWGNSCTQKLPDIFKDEFKLSGISEDCLYLNVWTPNPAPKSAAVMVYIHGGGFSLGSTEFSDFTVFSATQEVIVVSMNYRLSSLGFLYLGTENCPGNMGLMDQDLAMKWVRENIDRFGGDPNRITIFGHSSGSISVGHHLLNPNSEKLFQRAILQSGSPIGSLGRDSLSQGIKKSMKLAENVGCANTSEILETLECLKNVDSSTLVLESSKLGDGIQVYHFPVVDNKYVFDVDAATSSLQKKEVMLGFTSNDGGVFPKLLLLFNRTTPESLFETFVETYIGPVSSEALRSIRYYYKDHCNEVSKFKEETATMLAATDFFFTCDTTRLADILSDAGVKTYLYQFTHRPLSDTSPEWIGADHGAETSFLMGTPNLCGPELELSQRIMTYWSSFAKHGDPNVDSSTTNGNFYMDRAITAQNVLEHWSSYNLSGKCRLDIGLYYSRKRGYAIKKDQCDYWKHDFPLIQTKIQYKS